MKKQSLIPKKRIMSKLLATVLVFAMIFSTFVPMLPVFANDVDTDVTAEPVAEIVAHDVLDIELPEVVSGGNILHAWNMSFDEIIRQLPYIADAGFNTIQTSPIGDSIFQFPYYDGGNPTSAEVRSRIGTWWMLYQPRSFEIGNMLGTEAEFRALTAAAEEFGIAIIVDAVPNHTTSWWDEVDESLRRPELFHSIPGDGGQWDRNISNWGNREESRRARLLGLITFNTGSTEFQELYFDFLGRIIDAGATGFRYDAMVHIELPYPHDAAHIASDFWPNVQQFVDERVIANGRVPFQYGEILHRWHDDYLRALPGMSVTACTYGYHIRNNIIQGRLGNWDATNFHVTGYEGATPDRFVTWVESHDTYGNAGMSRNITDNQMRVGWAIMTARQGTTPLFLVRPESGFVNDGQMFSRNNDGTYTNNWGHSEFYRDSTITEVNWFANRFIDQPEHTSTHFDQVALIERGPAGATEGVVIVNSGNQTRAVDFPVQMVDGAYIDQVSGQTFTVTNGRITGPAVLGQSVAVIHGTVPRDTTPSVFATPDSAIFLDRAGITITLGANHTIAQYFTVSRNGDVVTPETAFNHGDEMTIGADATPGDEFILTLTGTNGEDVVTETFTYTKGDPYAGVRIEFVGVPWEQPRIWGWHEGGGNIFALDWDNAPLMVWEDDVNAWVYTINPANHPQFNAGSPFNVMFHNGQGQQLPTGAPYWLIHQSTRIEIVDGSPVFIPIQEEPIVFANPGSTTFYHDEGITITLGAQNVERQTFAITAGSLLTVNDTDFYDGQQITVGANAFPGDEFIVVLRGWIDGVPVTEQTFIYTRGETVDPDGIRIEFVPNGFWEHARIWAWRPGGGNVLPGTTWNTAQGMTWCDEVEAMVFTFDASVAPPFYVIFHNGNGVNAPSTQVGNDWLITESVRIEMVNGNWLFTSLDPSVEPADTAALEALVAEVTDAGLVAGAYTVNSWAAFQHALNHANAVLANEAASQAQVDAAYDALRTAFNHLVAIATLPSEDFIRIEFAHDAWELARIWGWRPAGGGNIFTSPFSFDTAPLMTWEADVNAWVFTIDPTITAPFYVMFHNGSGSQLGSGLNWFITESTRIEFINGSWELLPITPPVTTCPTLAEGQFAGEEGAQWRVCEDGTLEVDEGFINWTLATSPWHAHQADINNIVFTGPITAGSSLRALFRELTEVETIEGLTYFDTTQTANMSNMFRGLSGVTELDVSSFDTSQVTNMNAMFMGASGVVALDLSTFDTSQVTDMTSMFRDASSLQALDLSSFNTSSVLDLRHLLNGATSLRELTLGVAFEFIGNANLPAIPQTESFTGRWVNETGALALTSAQLISRFDGATMSGLWVWEMATEETCPVVVEGQFAGATGATWWICEDGTLEVTGGSINWTGTNSPWHAHRAVINEIVFTGPIHAGTDLRALFRDLTEVTTIDGLSLFDTSQTVNMSNMFRNASRVTDLDLSNFDTSNVLSMNAMFMGASSLTELDVSTFDTSRVLDMESMFRGLSNANITELDLSNFNTERVITMANMFRDMRHLEALDLSTFNTSQVTDMRNMLNGMPLLRELTLGEDFAFVGTAHLQALARTGEFTGRWVDETGTHVLSSAQLMANFDRATMAGTWTWQLID